MSDNVSKLSQGDNKISITGSRKWDTALFFLLLVFLLIGSYYLRVYYTVTVADYYLVYVSPSGAEQRITLPPREKKYASASVSTQTLLDSIEDRMKKYIGSSGLYLNYLYKTPRARIELIINYSHNSTKL